MTDLVASRSPYIDGTFVQGDAGSFAVVDPATEEAAFEVEASSVAQVDQAIDAARRAFDEGPWPRMSLDERARGDVPLPPTRSCRAPMCWRRA